MDDEARKGSSPPCGSPLMKTDMAKGLFQVIVGSWKIRHLITEKEVRRVTLCDIEEMGKRSLPENAQCGCLFLHLMYDDPEPELPLCERKVFCLIKDLDELMDPSIDISKGFPIGFCCLKGIV
jgi:hypothetical protein